MRVKYVKDQHSVRIIVSPRDMIHCPHQTGKSYVWWLFPDEACTLYEKLGKVLEATGEAKEGEG